MKRRSFLKAMLGAAVVAAMEGTAAVQLSGFVDDMLHYDGWHGPVIYLHPKQVARIEAALAKHRLKTWGIKPKGKNPFKEVTRLFSKHYERGD